MKNKHKVKYQYLEMNQFIKIIKRYNLYSLLLAIANISSSLFFDNQNSTHKGFSYHIFSFSDITGNKYTQEIYLTAWDLLDISYQAIKYCNNVVSKTIIKPKDVYRLLYIWQITKKEGENEISQEKPFNLLLYTFGSVNEQKKFQSTNNIYKGFERDLYILNEVSRKINSNLDFSLKEIIKTQIGIDVNLYNNIINKIVEMCKHNPLINIKNEVNRDYNLYKTIHYYSVDYNEIINSNIKRNILITKPIVRINNEYLLISVYNLLIMYEHSLFWLSRDYYKKKESQEFINYFGKCFEEYFKELLEKYIEKDKYHKIEESNYEKTADWDITLDDYHFLIEQKSSLLRISCKQQDPDVNEYKLFLDKSIKEALEQLESSSKHISEGEKVYKIILLYEDYIQPEIISRYIDLYFNGKYALDEYWLINIEEMEELLYCYKNNKKLFDIVMKELVSDYTNQQGSKSLSFIFRKYKWGIHHHNYY